MDSAEVNRNWLLPGLQMFRLYDEIDDNNRLWHAYQLCFIGDMAMGLTPGHLSCTVIDENKALLVMPIIPGMFVHGFKQLRRILAKKGKMTLASSKAMANAVNKYKKNKELIRYKVLIVFDRTGETITNAAFSKKKELTGTVSPKTAIVPHTYERNEKKYKTHNLVVTWTIARQEEEERYGDVVSDNEVEDEDAVGDDLSDDDDDDDDDASTVKGMEY